MTILTSRDGSFVDLLTPTNSRFTVRRICHGLASILRFNGDTSRPYSVAEHTINHVMLGGGVGGLLHDAAEAYIGDMPAPLKTMMRDFDRIDHGVTMAMYRQFCVDHRSVDASIVTEIDLSLRAAERVILRDESVEYDSSFFDAALAAVRTPVNDPETSLRLLFTHYGIFDR